jgi:hypothetical protein
MSGSMNFHDPSENGCTELSSPKMEGVSDIVDDIERVELERGRPEVD